MRFLARDEAGLLEKKLRLQIADRPRPRLVLYSEGGEGDYSAAASAIAASVGAFTEATLHFLYCVTGDGWNDGTATNTRWSRYRRWRSANGDNRRLSDAPAHVFDAHEAERLSQAVDLALQLGWDALLSAQPGRQLLLLSHDDRLEIYRGFQWRLLAQELIGMGYWHR